ncbi:YkvA family protein [Peribacillus sp. SCS-26]|uniref:YkvA family protein n=1 Tax=Paraperibacillus marinus TaxID=3115295 RepID=UPI0039061104
MKFKKFEGGHKNLLSKSKDYFNNKDKAAGLLKEAVLLARNRRGNLSDVWENLQLMFQVSQAWIKGEYKAIPAKSIMTILAVFLYFVIPTDSIPDFLLGIGMIDDAAVIGFAVKSIMEDLEKFKAWKSEQAIEEKEAAI